MNLCTTSEDDDSLSPASLPASSFVVESANWMVPGGVVVEAKAVAVGEAVAENAWLGNASVHVAGDPLKAHTVKCHAHVHVNSTV